MAKIVLMHFQFNGIIKPYIELYWLNRLDYIDNKKN